MSRDAHVLSLLHLFRHYGYDGATLSKISEATGLGKASLYHHFPGGKDEMVGAVLDYIEQWLVDNVLPALQKEGDALTRLQRMCDRLNELYENGQQPCITATLLLGSARDAFHTRVEARYRSWINAIAGVLIAAGLDAETAQARGEDSVIAIQGSLILAQGLNNPAPFQRTLKLLPQQLCRDLEVST